MDIFEFNQCSYCLGVSHRCTHDICMTYIYIHIYIYVYTCMHIYIYIHTHTCTISILGTKLPILLNNMTQNKITEIETALFLVSPFETQVTWIREHHCCLECNCILSLETKLYFNTHEQWFCEKCAKQMDNSFLNFQIVDEGVTKAILQSINSLSYTCGICNNFQGVTKNIMHYHTSPSNKSRQILLGGRFMDAGFGNITPRICKSACIKMPTTCRFCNKPLPSLKEWPFHVMTECTKVPCILSNQCIQDGILDYIDRLALHTSPNIRNLSCIFNDFEDSDYCTWGAKEQSETTWKQMIEHLQQHGNDATHAKLKKLLSSLRAYVNDEQNHLKRKHSNDNAAVSEKSPRLQVGTPNVIFCGKRPPKDHI